MLINVSKGKKMKVSPKRKLFTISNFHRFDFLYLSNNVFMSVESNISIELSFNLWILLALDTNNRMPPRASNGREKTPPGQNNQQLKNIANPVKPTNGRKIGIAK